MKVLIIDIDGAGLSFAWRCSQHGHSVRWFVKSSPTSCKDSGQGFKGVERIQNWVASATWADVVFTTGNADYLERLDFFKKKGVKVFAPSAASANLEVSRKAGMEMMKKVGIEIAPYKTFKTIKEAEAHVKKTKERFVFKTMGDNEDKSLTYVSKHAADLLGWLAKIQKDGTTIKGEVMLQTFIKGTEVGVSRWMGSKGWVGQYNESFEHKKLMPGNHGCNTGEMGTVAAFVEKSKLGEETLAKLEKELLALGHLGDTAIGFMIDEKGKPWPTEFTMRPGWPIFNMMLGSIKGDPAQWMLDACNGKDTTSFSEDVGICLMLTTKEFLIPKAVAADSAHTPVYGVTKGNKRHLHPHDIKIDVLPDMENDNVVERPLWNTAGPLCMIVTGFGKDVKQAAERAYKTADQIHISDVIIRDDIGEGLEKQLPELHKLGYATHFNYDKVK